MGHKNNYTYERSAAEDDLHRRTTALLILSNGEEQTLDQSLHSINVCNCTDDDLRVDNGDAK